MEQAVRTTPGGDPLPEWVSEYGAYFSQSACSWQWANASAIGAELQRRKIGYDELGTVLGYRSSISATNALRGYTQLSLRACVRLVEWLRDGGAPAIPDLPPLPPVPTPNAVLAPAAIAPAELVEQARAYIEQSQATNTRRAYRSDWADFAAWCEARGVPALPASPETLTLYLTDRAQSCKPSTLQRRLVAINLAHRTADLPSPTKAAPVREAWKGIQRTHGTAQEGKAAILTPDLKAMLGTFDRNTLLGKRDAALLLVGFAGAFRRSELVGLNREDLALSLEGVTITLRRSKTDQAGEGQKVAIHYGQPATCPVRALQAWLSAASITEGPLFRSVNRHGQVQAARLSDKAVALVVKRCAEAAGLDPAQYAGHSLRAGLVTSAAIAGAAERSIMKQTRHRSERMVRKYIRDADLFRDNVSAQVGL